MDRFAVGLLGVLALGGAALATPNRNAVSAQASMDLPSNDVSVVITSAALDKGRPHSCLVVEASLTNVGAATPRVELMQATVNGIALAPDVAPILNCPKQPCSLTSHFWLDLDAAEAASPGLLINKPLAIALNVSELTGDGDTGVNGSFTATLVKK